MVSIFSCAFCHLYVFFGEMVYLDLLPTFLIGLFMFLINQLYLNKNNFFKWPTFWTTELGWSSVRYSFPCGSAGKEICLHCGRSGFNPWVGKIPWRRERLPTPVLWSGEFHGLYSSWGRKESDTTETLSLSKEQPDFWRSWKALPFRKQFKPKVSGLEKTGQDECLKRAAVGRLIGRKRNRFYSVVFGGFFFFLATLLHSLQDLSSLDQRLNPGS